MMIVIIITTIQVVVYSKNLDRRCLVNSAIRLPVIYFKILQYGQTHSCVCLSGCLCMYVRFKLHPNDG